MPEYLSFRCCMCPNVNTPENPECPAGGHCRFVKTYRDENRAMWRVMADSKGHFVPAHWQPNTSYWRYSHRFTRQNHFDEAQTDLNAFAKRKGWKEENHG